MTSNLDIYRAAKLVIEQHSGQAALLAASRVDEFLDEGDVEGATVWGAIVRAIEELQRGRRTGEAMN
jgi:hypothetical protein